MVLEEMRGEGDELVGGKGSREDALLYLSTHHFQKWMHSQSPAPKWAGGYSGQVRNK